MSQKFLGYVPFHDGLPLLLEDSFSLVLHHVMLAEMRNVFGMYQILLPCILIVKLFEVMNFVFVLIIAVVARTHARVRQLHSFFGFLQPYVPCDHTRVRWVEDFEDIFHEFVLLVSGGIF
jgi:hypothetical protein